MLLLDGMADVRDFGSYRLARQTQASILTDDRYWSEGSIVIEADSLRATFEAIGQHCPFPRGMMSSSRKGRGMFNSFETYEDAWRTFVNEPSILRSYTENDTLLTSIETAGNDVYMDVTGDFLDIGTYLEGSPECFGSMQMGRATGFVTILVNMCISGGTPHHTITQFSKRVIRLVDWLEANSIRTRVIGLRANEVMHYECTVKRYEDHLDLNDIAVLSNPDFHRRVLFRATEYSPSHKHSIGGYGSATSLLNGHFTLDAVRERFGNELVIFVEKIATDSVQEVDGIYDQLERDVAEHLREYGTRGGLVTVRRIDEAEITIRA